METSAPLVAIRATVVVPVDRVVVSWDCLVVADAVVYWVLIVSHPRHLQVMATERAVGTLARSPDLLDSTIGDHSLIWECPDLPMDRRLHKSLIRITRRADLGTSLPRIRRRLVPNLIRT